jgi:23S rRNA maturation-related 3'-5' exoribonuclease YhaM
MDNNMELENGKIITKSFKISKINVSEKSAEVTLIDENLEKILGILKDNIGIFTSTYSVGEKVMCKGMIRKLRKNFCLDIIWISKTNLENDAIQEKFDANDYQERFLKIIEDIKDVDYKRILTNCFNEDVLNLFFSYPATKTEHHNYISGLLKHSVDVVEISLILANRNTNIDKDLLCCAGLLHDIGYLKSYDVDDATQSVTITEWEDMLGHSSMSALFISKILTQDVEQKKALSLYSLVLNHHKNEYNSKESFILNKADEISIFMG